MSKTNLIPPHPGEHVLQDCIKPLGLTIIEAAAALKTSRKNLSSLVNGRSSISAEMAMKLEKVFGSTAEAWLRLQANYDLALANRSMKKWKPGRSYIGTEARV